MPPLNQTDPITVSISVLAQMFVYLRSLNINVDDFLVSIGQDPAQLKNPDTRLPIEQYLAIEDAAAAYTGDPCFGLHMGEYAEPGSWSILGYLMMNCRTLAEAMEKSGRYSRIIGNLISATPQIHFNKLKIILTTPAHAPKMSRHCFEATFSSIVRMVRTLTGKPLSPWEVTFQAPPPGVAPKQDRLLGVPVHPEDKANPIQQSPPGPIEEYERVFGCPVYFGQRENSMTIDLALGNTSILMANDDLKGYFEKYAQDFIASLGKPVATTNEVTKIILSRLDDPSLTIQKVAKEMALSVRSLQNRLEKEGAVFSDLLQEIREKLATRYLQENYTVEQITYMLGFSEPSVFRKAFKKWSGLTPREYRQTQSALHP